MKEQKRSPLSCGEPCRRHNCIKCCIDTRMPLTSEDIERISSLGYKIEDFAIKVGREWRLKNKFGKCYFLTEKGCRIYEFRPEGCKLYPLIYDEDYDKPVLDELCPYREEFKPKKSDYERLLRLIEKLRTETETKNSQDAENKG